MTTIWDLPEDMLVEEIFSRVPLNYIKSVRSTCKKWNTLLRSRIIGKAEAKKQFTGFMMMNHKVCFIEFHLQNAFIYYCNHPCIKQVSILDQINVSEVIYSDGLLLCITKYELLVWNPYLGQTRWIQPRTKIDGFEKCFLGYDKNLNHKILSPITGFEIYDFSSDSWNVLDVTPPPDWEITPNSCVSLKGNTYFCARRREVSAAGRIINVEPNFLVCFDFTTESFGPRLPLPFDSGNYAFVSLSCVREEQLAVLYQFRMTHEKIDIFVTNKISPSVVSWIKFIVGITGILLHLGDGSFFIDEETKLAVVFGRDMITRSQTAHTIETSGYSKSVLIGNASAHRPLVCSSYAPSSVQIKQSQEALARKINRRWNCHFYKNMLFVPCITSFSKKFLVLVAAMYFYQR
uniref:F-box domain-containing protein n=1 Tax=Brassica oleracea var. oleracea TaxID=109376 RepID=A0A0D3BTS7_BRAOL